MFKVTGSRYNECTSVADPGPLMLGVLDRWTRTVKYITDTNGANQFPYRKQDTILAYIATPRAFGFLVSEWVFLFKKANVPGA